MISDREYNLIWAEVVERFTTTQGRAPFTKLDWDTVEAAANRIRNARNAK